MAALSVDGIPMPALPNSADQINYDNTTSGLSATTVKGAVDELASEKQDKSDDSLRTTDKTIPGAINELKSGLTNVTSKVPIRGAFTVACSVGQNIFNRSTMTLVEGTIPTHSFAYCLFGICNHGSSLDSPNTVESDGADSIIINAKSAQNIRIGWLDMTNIPFQTT